MTLTYTGIIIFYLSYLVFPFLIYIICQYQNFNKPLAIILALLSFLFIYARFIEPNIIKIKRHKIKLGKKGIRPLKIAVFSDLHIGLFTKGYFLKRVVNKLNKIDIDFIVIPGDLTWYLSEDKIRSKLAWLKKIQPATFAVLGNHDCGGHSQRDVSKELKRVLTSHNLKILDNEIRTIKIKGQIIKIIGLSDLETRQPNYNLINNLSENNINIVLTHNPDAAYEFPSYNMDLVICGHTHGGQIRIYPFYKYAYKYIAKMKYDFDKGLRNFKGTKVFITSGIGMTGLPFRFLIPPTIDILKIE